MIKFRWFLSHRPSTGEIRVRVYGTDDFVVDSGPVTSLMYLGGRLGVYTFHQSMVSWYVQIKINWRVSPVPKVWGCVCC